MLRFAEPKFSSCFKILLFLKSPFSSSSGFHGPFPNYLFMIAKKKKLFFWVC